MAITITLDDKLTAGLADGAKRQQLTVEQFAINILTEATAESEEFSLEALVEENTGDAAESIFNQTCHGKPGGRVANRSRDPNFDEEAWNRQWSGVQAEMKAITRANDIAEGRG